MRFSAYSSVSLLPFAALLAGLLLGGLPSSAAAQGASGSISERQEDQMMSLLASSPMLKQLARKAGASPGAAPSATERPGAKVLRSPGKARAAGPLQALGLGALAGSFLTWLPTATVAALGVTVIRSLWHA